MDIIMGTLWLVVKSDLKRNIRDKVGWIMMVLFPILMIFILSNAFSTIMNKSFKMEPFSVGYSFSENSPLKGKMPEIINGLKKDKITLLNMQKTPAMKEVANGNIVGYVEFGNTGYTFYKGKESAIYAGIFESVLKGIAYKTGTYSEVSKRLSPVESHLMISSSQASQENYAEVKKLDVPPFPSSLGYYSIVMIVNTVCFGIVLGPVMINQDRKRRAQLRMSMTPANPFIFFTSKLICSFIMSIIQIFSVVLSAKILLGVTFGSNPALVIGVLMFFAVAANAFGVMLGYLFNNIGLTRMLIFMSTFFLNFLGGSYMQYLYQPDSMLKIMKKLPIYYINRSLVEVATKGSSTVFPTAIIIIASIFVGSVLLGALIYSKKEAKTCIN